MQLETAATAGVALVLGLIVLLGVRAFLAGFPGIVDGDVPLWSMRPDQHLPEAFSVLGGWISTEPGVLSGLTQSGFQALYTQHNNACFSMAGFQYQGFLT